MNVQFHVSGCELIIIAVGRSQKRSYLRETETV